MTYTPPVEITTDLASTLPGRYYHDPAIWQIEQERIFSKLWLCVGRADAVPRAGDYFLTTIAGESLIIVRGPDGAIRAFYNVCRHRGARLCLEPCGHLKGSIQCPYHAWTYGLDGVLIGAPNMKGVRDFQPERFGLKPVALQLWEGLIWVNLSDQPLPLDDQLGADYARFAYYHIGELKSAKTIVYDVKANWKLVFDNAQECYHCAPVHKELSALVPMFKAGFYSGFFGGGAEFGEGVETLTLSGKSCWPVFRDLPPEDHRRFYGRMLWPNVILGLQPNYVWTAILLPLAIDRTVVTVDFLFEPAVIAQPDFDPSDAVDLWDMTNKQDWAMCERAQLGTASRAFADGGVYSAFEQPVRRFNEWVLRQIGELPERENGRSPGWTHR